MSDLPSIVEDQTKIPEGMTDYYTAGEGGAFRLNVTPVGSVELADTGALKNALNTERTSRENFEKQLKGYGNITADRAKELDSKFEEINTWSADKKTQELIDARVQTAMQGKVDEIAKLQGKLTTKNAQYKKLAVDSVLNTALLAPEIGGNPDLLLDKLSRQIKTIENEDGTNSYQVVDENGTLKLGNDAQPLTIEQFVAEKKLDPRLAGAFSGNNKSGAGTQNNQQQQQQLPQGTIVISRTDQDAIKSNWEGIKNGTVILGD